MGKKISHPLKNKRIVYNQRSCSRFTKGKSYEVSIAKDGQPYVQNNLGVFTTLRPLYNSSHFSIFFTVEEEKQVA